METLEVTLTHPAAAFAAMVALEGMSEEPPHADGVLVSLAVPERNGAIMEAARRLFRAGVGADDIVVGNYQLESEPGFAGALNLVDRESGDALMLMLWETREHAELPLRERGPAFLQALGSIMETSTGTRRPNSLWQVNAASRDSAFQPAA